MRKGPWPAARASSSLGDFARRDPDCSRVGELRRFFRQSRAFLPDVVLGSQDSARVGAVGAAVVVTGCLDSVSDDLAMAVLALGREGVNGALEAVEDVMASGERDFEGLVIVVSADLTDWHLQLLSGRPSRHSGRGASERERCPRAG